MLMKRGGFLLVASLFFMPFNGRACLLAVPDPSFAGQATFAAVAHASSDRWDSETGRLLVRVVIDEVLVGDGPEDLEAISPCATPIRRNEKVVAAVIDGALRVYPADEYESMFRRAFPEPR